MLAILPFIGVAFLRSNWKGKVLAFLAGGFSANTVVATRSRAGFLAAGVGIIAALIFVPKGGRKRIWPLVILGALGSLTLVDSGFRQRMTTLEAGEREKDASAQDRIVSWKAGLRMFRDHPMGVGPGNFGAHMGRYLDGHEGRDTHNTYIRCMAELGIPGMVLFTALIVNAFYLQTLISRDVADHPDLEEIAWHVFAMRLALIMYLIAAIFGSFNYIEMFNWILLMPVALRRVVANALDETSVEESPMSPEGEMES